MGNTQEAVWKDTELKGPEKTVMAYLAYRANDDGLCWPGLSTIEDECGISRNTRKKVMIRLQELGRIEIQEMGHGRGNQSVFKISDLYLKGVRFNPLSDDKRGQIEPPLEIEKGSDLTPIVEEKGSNLTEKGSNLNVEEQEELINNNYYSDPVQILTTRFEELTTLTPPHESSVEYQDNWLAYFERWLGLCNGKPERVGQLMSDAIHELQNNGTGKRYRITRPKSIDVAISNLVMTRGVTLEAGPDYGQDFDTYFSVMAARQGSLRNTDAPAYVLKVMNQIGRGEFQNCDSFRLPGLRQRFIQLAQQYHSQQVPA